MAKKQDDDITFDRLQSINLDVPGHLEEITAEEVAPPRPSSEEKERDMIKTSFKIERDLHLGLKQYCLMHGEEMAKVVFDRIVKRFLTKEGYYPPKKIGSER